MLWHAIQGAGGFTSAGGGWDLSTAVFEGTPDHINTIAITQSEALFFGSDGAKMYTVISSGTAKYVYQYELSTAWDVSTGSYLQRFSISAQEASATGIFFKPDGTKMYICGASGDAVYEYDLSTAWDISTASYVQNFSVATEDTVPQEVFFKPDGTKMYICGDNGNDINEYDLSTAWDISTASYLQNFSVVAQTDRPRGMFFKSDGTKMYVLGYNPLNANDRIYEYNLSTAWDISTASYDQGFIVGTLEPFPSAVFFKPDGTVMFITGLNRDNVWGYYLSTAWDISTAQIDPMADCLQITAQERTPEDLFFKPDGTKMYVLGSSGDYVNEYDLSTAWDIKTAIYLQRFSVYSQESLPCGLFFKPDGTKMYITGAIGDDVTEYDLSTAWDISTASYVQVSIKVPDAAPRGIFFKPDGTKMYVTGSTSDSVYEYDLSTPWDVSTISLFQSKSVSAQETDPSGVFFKDDGTKMYVIGTTDDDVNEYDLSTAWDISTASYVQNFYVGVQESIPTGLFFKPDGTKMYITGISAYGTVWAYTLS
jgi:DNA-binding beta-propeller fold protein YncE